MLYYSKLLLLKVQPIVYLHANFEVSIFYESAFTVLNVTQKGEHIAKFETLSKNNFECNQEKPATWDQIPGSKARTCDYLKNLKFNFHSTSVKTLLKHCASFNQYQMIRRSKQKLFIFQQ